MEKDSPFSPASILSVSKRSFKSVATKLADVAQSGDRPSDFGDHEPIDESAVVQISMGKEAVHFKALKKISAKDFLELTDAEEKGEVDNE